MGWLPVHFFHCEQHRQRRVSTSVQLLGGQSSGTANLQESFSHLSLALNDNVRASDVLSFSGVSPGTGETDIFVLQLHIDPTLFTSNSLLLWLNPATNQWVNAVDGNFGGTPTLVSGAYNSASDFQLGDYGVDSTDGDVWAVLDHNSSFSVGNFDSAAVPEPSTWILLGLGMAALGIYRRRLANKS